MTGLELITARTADEDTGATAQSDAPPTTCHKTGKTDLQGLDGSLLILNYVLLAPDGDPADELPDVVLDVLLDVVSDLLPDLGPDALPDAMNGTPPALPPHTIYQVDPQDGLPHEHPLAPLVRPSV
eukprot:gene31760-6958_t